MKTKFYFAVIFFCINSLYCQKNVVLKIENDTITTVNGSFYFKQSLPEEVSPQKQEFRENKRAVGKADIEEGYRISTLYKKEVSKGKYDIYYKYWKFPELSGADNKVSKASIYNGNIYSMPEDKFIQLTSPLYRRFKGFSVGAYTVPFRLRGIGGKDFDFESSLSLQSNFIVGWGSAKSKRSWFDVSVGLGVTGVNLNSKNSLVTQNRTATALTVSLGALLKPTNYVNVGVFIGQDYLGERDKDVNWKYNGKTWIGLGVNITFNELRTNELLSADSGQKDIK